MPRRVPRPRTRLRPALFGTAAVFTAVLAASAPVGATNDAEWGRQWGPQRIGVERAFAAGVTGGGVRIGLVDTGVDLGHQDLAGRIVSNAACLNTGGDPSKCTDGGGGDADGHGTHVAGIAAATKDNGVGIAGVAPGAGLVVARVFEGSAEDGAYVSDVTSGIKHVVDRGAKVVNLSLGDSLPLRGELFGSSSLDDGIAYAWDHGAVAVLAAGNSNYFGLGAANYGSVNAVVVGATGRSDRPAAYSSPTGNAKWAVVAPGGDNSSGGEASEIFSTLPGGYGYMQGTSMAAPHVSGALALLMAQGRSNADAVSRLLATVDRSVPCGANSPNCRGLVDVGCAVAGQCGPPSPDAVATPSGSGTGDDGADPGGATTSSPSGGSGASTAPSGDVAGSTASAPGDAPAATVAGAGSASSSGSSAGPGATAARQPGRGGAAAASGRANPAGPSSPTASAPGGAGEGTTDGAALAAGDGTDQGSTLGDSALVDLGSLPSTGDTDDGGPSLLLVGSAAALLVLVTLWGFNRRRS